jgi:hypothetical protein
MLAFVLAAALNASVARADKGRVAISRGWFAVAHGDFPL